MRQRLKRLRPSALALCPEAWSRQNRRAPATGYRLRATPPIAGACGAEAGTAVVPQQRRDRGAADTTGHIISPNAVLDNALGAHGGAGSAALRCGVFTASYLNTLRATPRHSTGTHLDVDHA